MSLVAKRLVTVQAISVSRLFAALLFSWIAFQPYPVSLIAGIYLLAALSDVLDGFLARKLAVESFAGKVIDLISDKSLTVVSLLYAAAREVPILPLAVIAARELSSLGLRLIEVNGSQLLPTSRIFGGVMACVLWGNTVFLLVLGSNNRLYAIAVGIYWICAVLFAANLAWRLTTNRHRIRSALAEESELE